ncbi:MAG: SIS domain-containing protein [Anaerolineae bacterium]|nr:SIS domain-containing protein [Anaerolineae bacterium]
MLNMRNYLGELAAILARIDPSAVEAATRVLVDAYDRDATIFVIGNGGSASTASHFALDLAKNPLRSPDQRPPRCVALTDNVAALTAWANDTSYDRVFEAQLMFLWRPGDVLVAISGSGNSPNVVRAVRWADQHDGTTVGLLGRGGGECAPLCHAPVTIPDMDYGHVETAHLAVCHYWVDHFKAYLKV